MTTFDKLKKLADKQQISIVELEEKLNFSRNSLYAWKKSRPSAEKLEAVADYFNVSTDYLLGRTDNPQFDSTNEQHELTVEEALNSVMSYDGQPLTDHDREVLTGIIEAYIKKNNQSK